MSDERRCGFVAVLGAPNAGKSTLVNALVGQKVAIVTHKVQTTRMPVRGIAMRGSAQIIFVDTPGIFAPKRRLDRAMVNAAWGGAADADAILVIVDSAEVSANPGGLAAGDTERIVEGLKQAGKRAMLVLNKIDGLKRETLLPLAHSFDRTGLFDRIFMVSAVMDLCAVFRPLTCPAARLRTALEPFPQLAGSRCSSAGRCCLSGARFSSAIAPLRVVPGCDQCGSAGGPRRLTLLSIA